MKNGLSNSLFSLCRGNLTDDMYNFAPWDIMDYPITDLYIFHGTSSTKFLNLLLLVTYE